MMSRDLEAALALNRFGLGARPRERAGLTAPKAWLTAQLRSPHAFALPAPEGLLSASAAAEALAAYRETRRDRRDGAPREANPRIELTEAAFAEMQARTLHALTTPHGFAERLVWFWSNHFTIAATKLTTIPFVGVHEREAIRPRMSGRFADMLEAAVLHQGMLLYLDQAQSVGPASRIGARREAGLNENLAREVLELHTLGAGAGYTQNDVTEFAKALTGWTIATERIARLAPRARPGAVVFIEALHEPGARTLLGKSYPDTGADQARAMLADLAAHPATARRCAEKLARHFIADDPPAAAVAHLERAFTRGDGALPALHEALIDAPDIWSPGLRKFKTPNEFIVSSLRLAGLERLEPRALIAAYDLLGQAPFRAPSPEGWPDDAASWAGPDAVMKRLEWAQAFAQRIGARIRPQDLADDALGPLLSDDTRTAIARAESAEQGFTLALMSPEFQRR